MGIYKLLGSGSEIEVFEDKLTLTPRGVLGVLARGLKGTKTIPFASITAIQHKKPGMTAGYLQFTLVGGLESTRGVFAAASDENTFMYFDQVELVEEMHRFIEQRIHGGPVPPKRALAAGASSGVEDLVKLAKLKEEGLLSEEEFVQAKRKLLGM